MTKPRLTLACGPYDRMEALRTGEVTADGIDLDMIPIKSPREIFDRVMAGADFDVAEMSTSEHIANTVLGRSPHVAIPVFPSRVFRHGFIVLNRHKGIRSPKDLAGRRIGVPLYTMTAAVWMRGMLEDDHSVDLSGVTWVQGAVEKAGSHGNPTPPPLLRPIKLEINDSGRSLDELLCAGEIDAYMGAQLPPSLGKHPDLVRLFTDVRGTEREYYQRTGIHPIMHLVVIKRAAYEANPWIAKSLYDAFVKAKAVAWKDLTFTGASKVMLPWVYDDIGEINQVFGGEPFVYGLEPNRHTLETLIGYMHRHDMIARKPALGEVFVDVGA
jgi:4,5-dihydroxyphthalate decarboxylase